MKFRLLPIVFFIMITSIILSCKTGSDADAYDESLEVDQIKEEINSSAKSIFYNMFLPCEMISLFNSISDEYMPYLCNSTEQARYYSTNNKKAINLGIYGVDLGYSNMFNQLDDIRNLTKTINKISQDLGIPQEHITYAMDYYQRHMDNSDSLFNMSCELFRITDSYLNSNERQSLASLIILGGWVEAMHITLNVYPDSIHLDIMERVGKQKYTLNSLISLLKINEENMMITNYLVMLKTLNNVYENIDIYYEDTSHIKIDTSNKIISTENTKVNMTTDQYLRIKDIINRIREQMIH